jgi:hypothetical protein
MRFGVDMLTENKDSEISITVVVRAFENSFFESQEKASISIWQMMEKRRNQRRR